MILTSLQFVNSKISDASRARVMIEEMIDMRNKFLSLKDEILCSPLNYIFASYRNIDRVYEINFFREQQGRRKISSDTFAMSFNYEYISILYSIFNLIYVQKNQNNKILAYILPSTDGYSMRNSNCDNLLGFLRQDSMNRNQFRGMAKQDWNEYFGEHITGDVEINLFILQIIFLLLSDNYHQVFIYIF
jgi:hypothetical protein